MGCCEMGGVLRFKTENELFKKALESRFFKKLASPENKVFCKAEAPNLYGIPDYVIFTITNSQGAVTYAFEMKLRHWKRALVQAYCYRAFANKSYVLLDHSRIGSPVRHIDEFKLSNVGLLSINTEGDVFVHFTPKYAKPYSKRAEVAWLRQVPDAIKILGVVK